MIWLYKLQHRLSITRNEGLAILTLLGLFLTGITARHIQKQQVPPLTADSLVARPHTHPEDGDVTDGPQAQPSSDAPININTAPVRSLETLPGVGPVLAKRIDAYRSNQRPFVRIEELQRVRGIGAKTLETLRPLVVISPPGDSTR